MDKREKTFRRQSFLSGLLVTGLVVSALPGTLYAAQAELPAGRIVFEDKPAGVIIIKTPNGVVLKITIDEQGRKIIKEIKEEPMK